ncbi:MAG: helix-turn-helix domain-containing protein [Pseudoclavibacter sp.]
MNDETSSPTAPARVTPLRRRDPLWRDLVGGRLRTVRNDRGDIIADVAERAGVSPQYLSEIERGRKEASSEIIAAVAAANGLTLLDLTLAVSEQLAAGAAAPAAAATDSRSAFALAA